MFPLRYEKLEQAVGLLLGLEPSHRMNYTKLIKVLYIADRESLDEMGEPIVGGETWCLPQGPILSDLKELIDGKQVRPSWTASFKTDGYDLVCVSDPGRDCLCDYEIDKLTELHARYRKYGFGRMIDVTHRLPECKKNKVASGRKRISLRDILEGLGIADQAAEIEDDAKEAVAYAAVLRR
jgi:hypothetical protein